MQVATIHVGRNTRRVGVWSNREFKYSEPLAATNSAILYALGGLRVL